MKRRVFLASIGSVAAGGCLENTSPEEKVKEDLTDGSEDLEDYNWSPREVDLDSVEVEKTDGEAEIYADVSISYIEDGDKLNEPTAAKLLEYDALHLWDALLDQTDAEDYHMILEGENSGKAHYTSSEAEIEEAYGHKFRIQQKMYDGNIAPDIPKFKSSFRDGLEIEYPE
jgi:hypothetical protein